MPMLAKLVYDGGSQIYVPSEMGTPREDQLQGTLAEQLCELAGRVCYDSCGVGRNSDEYHKHILDVNHTSTLEHVNFTVEFNGTHDGEGVSMSCLNRKGVYFEKRKDQNGDKRYVTLNLRSALEWDRYTNEHNMGTKENSERIFKTLTYFGNQLAPRIIPFKHDFVPKLSKLKTEELSENQLFLSMYMQGSRGFSHEQVRHRKSMSQRSTRYVDETDSEWIEHPLTSQYLNDESQKEEYKTLVKYHISSSIQQCRYLYEHGVRYLQNFLTDKKIDKLTARKQARGAMRGYLGNALATEMIFTDSVAGWKDMIRQRCSQAADAEIRLIYNQVVIECKRSRHGNLFKDMNLVPSSDGIGNVLEIK